MFTLHAFASTTPIASTLTNMTPVSDPVLSISGSFAFVPGLNNLIGIYGIGSGLLRLQASTPSMLTDVPYDVTPVDTGSLPRAVLPLNLHVEDPIPLVTDEPIQVLATASGGTVAEAFVFLSDGPLSKVSGKIIRVRATATSASSVDAWANSALTLTNQLAEGSYNLVGARFEGDHILAGRFVFPGGNNANRPGAIGSQFKYSSDAIHPFRNGNLGVWGTFTNRVLPTVDLYSDGTGETVTVILDLIKA